MELQNANKIALQPSHYRGDLKKYGIKETGEVK
jgi:hypothetical protein